MRIKKFVANSMPEAMKQIKDQLGKDAIILNSKEIKPSGIFGLFKRKKIEVTAMLDEDIRTPTEPRREKMTKPKVNPYIPPKGQADESRILDEIKHLQSILTKQPVQSELNFPPMLNNVYEYLVEQEVDTTIATSIVQSIVDESTTENLDRETIERLLENEIKQRFSQVSFDNILPPSKVIQFVGPTGVGKTTTIAKVAANSMLNNNHSVAFITADTYRIAAIEQLKTYATILDVPLEVVYSKADYDQALQKFASYDRIFVDTAGRNYREDRYIQELNQFIATPLYPTQTFLVLSLTAKTSDIKGIYDQFKKLNIEQVIFTKLDETNSYGSLLNLAENEKVGIAYLTNGQNVPDDLLQPDAAMMTEMILRRYKDA